MRDADPAATGHPDTAFLYVAVQIAAAPLLVQEGVEGG
jgi:hypothetical protein